MKRVRSTPPATLEIAPLIDIVFILLIFFVVTSSFIDEVTLEVNLPDVSVSSGNVSDHQLIVVLVSADSQVYVGEELIPANSASEIAARIQSNIVDQSTAAIEIRADEDSRHAAVVRVLDALSSLGLTRVNLITERSSNTDFQP